MNKRNLKNNIKEFFCNLKKFYKNNNKLILVIVLLLVLLFNLITCVGSLSSHRTAFAAPVDHGPNSYYYAPYNYTSDAEFNELENGVDTIDYFFRYVDKTDGSVLDYGDPLFQTIDFYFPFCDFKENGQTIRLRPLFNSVPITFVYLAANDASYWGDSGQDRGYIGFIYGDKFVPFQFLEDEKGKNYSQDIQMSIPYFPLGWFTAQDDFKGDYSNGSGYGYYRYFVRYSFVVRFATYETLENGFTTTSNICTYRDGDTIDYFGAHSIAYTENKYANAIARYSATALDYNEEYGLYNGRRLYFDDYYLSYIPSDFTPTQDPNSYAELYSYMSGEYIIHIRVSYDIEMTSTVGYNPMARLFVGSANSNERIDSLSNFRFDDYYQSMSNGGYNSQFNYEYYDGTPIGVDFSLLYSSDKTIVHESGNYDEGFEAGREEGFNDGYADGLTDGRISGFEEGKIVGADLSLDEALETVNPFKRIQVWVDSLMNTELFPNVSLKLLFMFAIGMFLLVVIIKTFLGG